MLVSAGQHELAKPNDGDDQLLQSILAQKSPMIVRQRKLRLVRSALSLCCTLAPGCWFGLAGESDQHHAEHKRCHTDVTGDRPQSPNRRQPCIKIVLLRTARTRFAANSALEKRKNVDSKNSAAGSDRQFAFSPQQLELQAELAETRSESARLYRSAGDAFLKQNNVKEAVSLLPTSSRFTKPIS